MTGRYNSRTADKFVVRLPDGMRDQIDVVAKARHRSMNSEIIARLEASLRQDKQIGDMPVLRFDSPELSVNERAALKAFRSLPGTKQSALLVLLETAQEEPEAE